MESHIEEIKCRLIKEGGWKIYPLSKIRRIQPDFVVERDGKFLAVFYEGKRGDIENGIKKAMHFKNVMNDSLPIDADNYSCLAIPKEMVTDKIANICEDMGIGLIGAGTRSDEIVSPRGSSIISKLWSPTIVRRP